MPVPQKPSNQICQLRNRGQTLTVIKVDRFWGVGAQSGAAEKGAACFQKELKGIVVIPFFLSAVSSFW